jgi:hypothetical protein
MSVLDRLLRPGTVLEVELASAAGRVRRCG